MWVVVALCILIALTALLLSIPVDLDARVEVYGKPTAVVTVRWLFGRLRKTVRSSREEPGLPEGRRGKQKGEPTRKRHRTGIHLAWRLVHVRGLWATIARFMRRLFRCVRVRTLAVDFRAGLEDPADTALYFGAVCQAALLADLWSPYSVRLLPAFDGAPTLEGDAEISLRLRPITTVPPVLAFLLAPPTMKVIGLVIQSRWKRDS